MASLLHLGRKADRPSDELYQRFLRGNRIIARAANAILEGIGEFNNLECEGDFAKAIMELRATQEPDGKPESKIRELVERQLPLPRIDRTAIRRFSLVCRAAEVATGNTPWHHQIVCALLLHRSYIVQMPNGCGKTLAVAIAAGANSLTSKAAHLLTINDYLAERDARWMGRLYHLLGLSVGVLFTSQSVHFKFGIIEPSSGILRAAPKSAARSAAENLRLQQESGETGALPLEAPRLLEDAPATEGSLAVEFEYDDVVNQQREAIYALRRQWYEGVDQEQKIIQIIGRVLNHLIDSCRAGQNPDAWDVDALANGIADQFNVSLNAAELQRADRDALWASTFEPIQRYLLEKESSIGADNMRLAQRIIFRNVIEERWKSHLPFMQRLSHEFGSADAPADAIVSYKRASAQLFNRLLNQVERDGLRYLFLMRVEQTADQETPPEAPNNPPVLTSPEADAPSIENSPQIESTQIESPQAFVAPVAAEASQETPEPAPEASDEQPADLSTEPAPEIGPAQMEEVPDPSPAADRTDADRRLLHRTSGDYVIDYSLTTQDVLACDVVYGQIESFGFEYLRDNLAKSEAEQTLTRRDFLIVDECDSVLLDDLRLPLEIERAREQRSHTTHTLQALRRMAALLTPGLDFLVEGRSVRLTYEGLEALRRLSGRDFFRPEADGLARGIINAIAAAHVYKRDQDYVVRGDEVLLVEQESGRILFGRRYTGGLHQALEAKEGLPIQEIIETEATARITIKNFVQTYLTVAGTSGTIGVPQEYRQFYGLETIEIEPYPKTRRDNPDVVYCTAPERIPYGVIPRALEAAQRGQPVLINVSTLKEVADVADLLTKANVPFQTLDADTVRTLGEEADKIQRAGTPGLITVSSKMAARGTDIVLHPDAVAAGGLFVLGLGRGTERRYDDQLRGRAGRHGDPGDSVFVLSLQDPVLVGFSPPGFQRFMSRYLGMEEGVPIESPLISRRIAVAQRVIQKRDYDQRFGIVEQDDLLDRHRLLFYRVRQQILTGDDATAEITTMLDNWAARSRLAVLAQGLSAQDANPDAKTAFGTLGQFVQHTELGRVLQVKSRKVQARMMRELLAVKLNRALESAKEQDHSFKSLILTQLDEQWCRYLVWEQASREEIQLYSADDPTGVAKYAEAMEQQFDSFFYDVGEFVLAGVLMWHAAATSSLRAKQQGAGQ